MDSGDPIESGYGHRILGYVCSLESAARSPAASRTQTPLPPVPGTAASLRAPWPARVCGPHPVELLGRHLPVELPVEAASQAGESSRNDERAPSVASNRDAHELGSGLIIPNRAQGFPERRAVDPPEEPYRPEEGHQDHVVEARDEALWTEKGAFCWLPPVARAERAPRPGRLTGSRRGPYTRRQRRFTPTSRPRLERSERCDVRAGSSW